MSSRYHLIVGATAVIAVLGSCGREKETPAREQPTTPVATRTEPTSEAPACDQPTSWIAFASDRDGNFQIHLMNHDGSGLTRLWESFLEANPRWALRDSAARRYNRYFSTLVPCLPDDTPIFEDAPRAPNSGPLKSDVRVSYERLVARHGQTETARYIGGLLEVLQRTGYRKSIEYDRYLDTARLPRPGMPRAGR